MSTKEVAKLLNINEKKVYTLAHEGVLPGTKITGKWIFPKKELLDYIKTSSLKNISDITLKELLNKNLLLISGSNDFLLSFLFENFSLQSDIHIFYSNTGSKNGINDVIYKKAHIALSHIYNFEKKSFNIEYLKETKILSEVVVINLFKREIGFISHQKVESIADAANKKLKMIKRQTGSGIRNLQEHFIEKSNINKEFIFSEMTANSHFEVGLTVKKNPSLFGITTKSVADFFNLKFTYIMEEDFDMVLFKTLFFNEKIQIFLDFIRENISKLNIFESGYNFEKTGRIKNA